MLQGAMPTGTNLTSELLPLLLGSTGNLGGTAGIAMIGNQMPIGTLSTPVVNIPSTPSVTDSVNSSTLGVNKSTIQDWVNQYAPRYGLSPKLVNAVITQESGYSPSATSSAGAIGLMQLMPETASMLGVTNPYDPLSNLLGGMSYLGGLVNHYHGNISLALAAYNAGSHAVAQYGGIPPYPETQRYVQDILSLMNHA
jgi:soluble lytic murein transglycosylase-like protein